MEGFTQLKSVTEIKNSGATLVGLDTLENYKHVMFTYRRVNCKAP